MHQVCVTPLWPRSTTGVSRMHDRWPRFGPAAERSGRTALQELLDSGLVDRDDVVRTAATAAGLRYVDVADYSVNASAAASLAADFARRSNVLPLTWEDDDLLVAVGIKQAGNIELKDDLTRLTRSRIRFAVASRTDIAAKIAQVYRAEGELDDLTSDLVSDEETQDLAGLTEVSDEAPIVRFVNLLITQAISDRASDIHLEPTEHDLRVRYRIDGVLQEAATVPLSAVPAVISRIKILSDLDIAERRIPQDGRMSVVMGGRTIDLRVATLPTVWGEKVVMRILDRSRPGVAAQALGFMHQVIHGTSAGAAILHDLGLAGRPLRLITHTEAGLGRVVRPGEDDLRLDHVHTEPLPHATVRPGPIGAPGGPLPSASARSRSGTSSRSRCSAAFSPRR